MGSRCRTGSAAATRGRRSPRLSGRGVSSDDVAFGSLTWLRCPLYGDALVGLLLAATVSTRLCQEADSRPAGMPLVLHRPSAPCAGHRTTGKSRRS